VHHAVQRFIAAALVVDGSAASCQPADQGPATDLTLGDKADRALAMNQLDVDPRDMVGNHQGTTAMRLSEAQDAKAEDPHQSK